MSNGSVDQVLSKIEASLADAGDSQQVLDAVKIAVDHGSPLEFNHNKHWLFGGLGVLTGATLLFLVFIQDVLSYEMREFYRENLMLLVTIGSLLALGGALPIGFAITRENKIEKLARKAFRLDALWDNGITSKEVPEAEAMKARFSEFDRGNYSREFKNCATGEHQGDVHTFNYDFLHFHYVTQRTEVHTVSNGKGGTTTQVRTVYDHYDRYGLLVEFPFAEKIQVYSKGISGRFKAKFQPASVVFRDIFSVRAADELAASKFLKPAVVVAFENIAGLFKEVNVEISGDGYLYLSFEDSDVLSGDRQNGFENPQAFYDELAGHTNLRKLQTALAFIHDLMRHSD